MTIDTTTVIRNLDGAPVPSADGDLTLGTVLCDALLTLGKADDATGMEKVRRYRLAQAIHDGSPTLTAEDVVLLKDLVGAHYIPLVVGQVWDILDPV